jgi:putative ABC transport system permease protein
LGRLLLTEFWRDLSVQRTRVMLTLFSVFWGALTIVLLLAFGEGLKRAVIAGDAGAGQQIFMIYPGQTTRAFDGLPAGRFISLTEDDLDAIRGDVPGVDMTSVSYGHFPTVVESDDLRTTVYMEGVEPAFSEMRTMYPAAGGRFLDERDLEQRRRVVFLGDSLALKLFPGISAVGQRVKVDGLPYLVVGVMRSKMQTSMNNGPDAERAIIPASVFRAVYGAKHVDHLIVRPRDVATAEQVKHQIYETLGRLHHFDANDDRALGIWDFIEDAKMTRRIMLGIQIFLGVVGALTLLVAGIGVGNIMYVVVRERTREIGVKRAVGATRRQIVGQFLLEAVFICILGGGVGLGLGAGITAAVSGLAGNGEVMQFLGHPKLSWPIALLTVGILVTIGLAAGSFPARRAARLDPVDALRYE